MHVSAVYCQGYQPVRLDCSWIKSPSKRNWQTQESRTTWKSKCSPLHVIPQRRPLAPIDSQTGSQSSAQLNKGTGVTSPNVIKCLYSTCSYNREHLNLDKSKQNSNIGSFPSSNGQWSCDHDTQIKSTKYPWNRNFIVSTLVIGLGSETFWLVVPSVLRIWRSRDCGVKGVCHNPAPRPRQRAPRPARRPDPRAVPQPPVKMPQAKLGSLKVKHLIVQPNQVLRSLTKWQEREAPQDGGRPLTPWVSVQSPEPQQALNENTTE